MEVDLIMFWLILLIILLVVEAATLGLTTVWFAAGAIDRRDSGTYWTAGMAAAFSLLCHILSAFDLYQTYCGEIF